MRFKKIGFIGLGLIGGSIAKAIKKYYPDTEIYALCRTEDTVIKANEEGIILNNTNPDLKFFSQMDLIFLCSPVKINSSYLNDLKGIIKDSCIITDVGSVKGEINQLSKEAGLSSHFIGGHPMTGSEKTGIENSNPLLLENAYYILTPEPDVNPEDTEALRDLIITIKSLPLIVSPDEHDFAAACVSHLPHVISALLVNILSENDNSDELMKTIAAGGFRDITRISSSSPSLWQNICLSNKDMIVKTLDIFSEKLTEIRKHIYNSESDEIIDFFSDAKEYRDSLPLKKKGAVSPAYEFYTYIEDEVGGIASIARILADNEISIKNIGVIHNREFEDGVIRIEFYDMESMEKGINVMKENNYDIILRK